MIDIADRSRSVTKRDFLQATDAGGVWNWVVYDPGSMASPALQLPRIGDGQRDRMLTATLDLEDMWASAVNKAVTKIAVRGYDISDNDNSDRRVEKGKSLVMNFDGPAEYRGGMAKVVQDFLLCDNGWFIEVERESKSAASRPKALYHLDSFRCSRTGNLDYPVLYWDSEGAWHKLRRDQVIFGSDMPSPRSRMFGRGRCAASRAFQTIIKLSAVETYFREKITGSRALALYFISGLSARQLSDAVETSEEEKVRRGHVIYKGAVMVPVQGDQAINVATIELASVPDGFDVSEERKDGYLRYANAIGIPVQDVQPLSGQGLGTGTQSVILDEASEGQGVVYFVKDFEDKINYLVMPKTTVFSVKPNDIRDQKAKADVDNMKAAKIVTLLGNGQAPGVITPQMALQMAVDAGLVPEEFLPKDVTPGAQLTDSGEQSKPGEVARLAPFAPVPPRPPLALPNTVKAAEPQAAVPDEWEAAVKWAEEATKA